MRLKTGLLAFTVACASCSGRRVEPELNVMQVPPVCDSVPPPVKPGEQLGAAVPAGVHTVPDSAVLVGTLTQTTTGRPLGGATIQLLRDTTFAGLTTPRVRLPTNLSGGFVVTTTPGTYTLDIRRIGGAPLRQTLTLRAGVIDTLRLEMRYLHCIGY